MARRGSGLRTAIKIVKAIDRANKQAARESQRRQKAHERAHAQEIREHEREVREAQRKLQRQARLNKSEIKKAFKGAIANAAEEYRVRCEERPLLGNNSYKRF
ncbi:hypothetical protein ACN3E9_11275 [Vibrio pectenicida]|uniref:hypothetical protein n=1 Tax=Vibrio pectenicida TaxID=62763 RepID=UPI003B9963FE